MEKKEMKNENEKRRVKIWFEDLGKAEFREAYISKIENGFLYLELLEEIKKDASYTMINKGSDGKEYDEKINHFVGTGKFKKIRDEAIPVSRIIRMVFL